MVIVDSVYDKVKAEFLKRGCIFCNAEETIKLGDLLIPVNQKTGKRQMNPTTVGRPARELAEKIGMKVPAEHPCKVIIGEANCD